MKKVVYTIVAVCMATLLMITTTSSAVSAITTLTGDDIINIQDSYFLTVLQNQGVDLNEDGKISVKEMERLRYLDIYSYNGEIKDISGIEYAKNLVYLWLSGINISDLGFAKNMTKLTNLEISNSSNDFDISLLEEMKQLTYLSITNSSISDISVLKNLTNLRYLFLNSNKITDISPLSGLVNLKEINLHNNQISDSSPLKNLGNLNCLSLDGNNVPDVDLFDFAKIVCGEMYKGMKYSSGILPSGILNNYTLSSDNEDIIKIEYGTSIAALKEGEATIKLQYNGLSKSFKVKVNGIDAAQPLETSATVTTEFYENADLNSKGELWNLSDNGPKVAMNNVKKYVAYSVYEGEREYDNTVSHKLAITNDDTLWSWGEDKYTENGIMGFQNNKEEMKNVKYVNTRYAITNTNELWDYCTDEAKLFDNVKDVKRISDSYEDVFWQTELGTEVLKSDNTLWVRRDVKIGDTTNTFFKFDTGVKELTDSNGYIKIDGSYWQWNGQTTGNIVFKKIADGVTAVKSGFIVKTDKTVVSPYSNLPILYTGLKDIKRDSNYTGYYLVDNNNTLWFYNGSQTSKVSDSFKEFTESGFIKTDGKIYNYSNVEIDYVAKINSSGPEITLGKDNILYMSGVKLLTNVKNIYASRSYAGGYYAERTDGSIWEVGDRIPTKLEEIDYDINRDGVIDILDLANIGSRYNSISTATKYNKECDFNKDNIIDIYDVVSFSKKLRGPSVNQ